MGSRQDNFAVTVSVDDEDLGVFSSFEGGETDSEETKDRPGAMGDEESLGGPSSVGNVTVGRRFRPERDGALEKRLRAKTGRANGVVKRQPLDDDRNPFGEPLVLTGTLKRVTGPAHDANSTERASLELEFTMNGTVA